MVLIVTRIPLNAVTARALFGSGPALPRNKALERELFSMPSSATWAHARWLIQYFQAQECADKYSTAHHAFADKALELLTARQ